MHIRCPHCHNAVEVVGDSDLIDVSCPSCGSDFNLVPETESYSPSSRSIGHFQLLEQIGVGGFGTVFKARDTKLDRLVAVKIPRRDQIEPENVEMFLREARAAAQLRHEGIVAVHEVGREDDTLYIVSDFIQGATLADRLTAQAFTPRESALLVAQIGDALHHAHEVGVIHRDLKPQNIMLEAVSGELVCGGSEHRSRLTTHYSPKLLDFGLAKREAGEITMTADGKVLGTAAYMSPEQARGEGHHVDRRTDVYSLGVILFELLTLQRPFRGNARVLIQQVIHDEPPRPRKLKRDIPRDLETICLKCLEKDRQRRYATAGEVAEDLRRYLDDAPILARPISRVERAYRFAKRRPAAVTVAVLSLMLLFGAGFGVQLWWQKVAADVKAKALAESQVETVVYYAQLSRRRGEPVGVVEITQAQAEAMPRAYRFVRRGGVVERVDFVNALIPGEDRYGLPELLGAPRVFLNVHREASLVFTRNENARVTKEEAFDATNQLLWSLEYGSDDRAVFLDRRAADQSVRLNATRTALVLAWDASGWLREVRFVDDGGRPRPNEALSYGVRLVSGLEGELTRIETLDQSGKATRSEASPARVTLTYDQLGRLVTETYSDEQDRPTEWQGVATIKTRYDEKGYEIVFHGLRDQPCVFQELHPNISRMSWALTVQGAHRVRRAPADDRLRLVEQMLGVDGKPAGDHAAEECVFNDRGQLIQWLCVDESGQPVFSQNHGLARMRRSYDFNGNLLETINERQDQARSWKTISRQNSAGSLRERAFFSAVGEPITDANGVHRYHYAYDSQENRILTQYFDTRDEPLLHSDGVHCFRLRYDAAGNTIEASEYGLHDEPVMHRRFLAHRWTAKYDANRRLLEKSHFDVKGQPVTSSWGFAKESISYQPNGEVAERATWIVDETGELALLNRKDGKGRIWEEAFYSSNGEPLPFPNHAHHRVRRKFDNAGNELESAFFDATDKPVKCDGGTYRWTQAFDALGRLVEANHYDIEGKLMNSKWEFAHRTLRYANDRDHIEAIHYVVDEHGNLALRQRWGRPGVILDEYLHSPEGNPIRSSLEWHHVKYEVDDKNRRISTSFFDLDDQQILCGGSHRWTQVFDEKGRVVEEAHFGVDGKPINSIFGFAKRSTSYAADGRIERTVDHVVDQAGDLALNRAKLFGDLGANVLIKSPKGVVRWSQATLNPPGEIVAIGLANAALTPEHLRAAGEIPNLQHFHHQVAKNKLSDADLSVLARRTSLVALNLWFSPISDEQVKLLAPLENLQWINLGGAGISMDALPVLEVLPQLQGLHLEYLKRGPSGLEPLSRLKNLEGVSLWRSEIRDDDVIHLAACKNLKHLHLGRTPITDRGLAQLHAVKTLQYLCLGETKVTEEGVRAFQAAVLECRIDRQPDPVMPEAILYPTADAPTTSAVLRGLIAELKGAVLVKSPKGFLSWKPTSGIAVEEVNAVYSSDPAEVPRHIEAISELPKLEYLSLWIGNNYEIPDAILDQLATRDNLIYLVFWENGLTDNQARKLAKLTRLQHLNISGNKVTFEVLPELTDLAELRELHLAFTRRGPHGLQALARFPKLEFLNFLASEVSDDDLVDLVACKNLQRLYLGSTSITDRGLAVLHAAKSLRYLDLSQTKVTEEGVAAIRAALPDCQIELQPGRAIPNAVHFPSAVTP